MLRERGLVLGGLIVSSLLAGCSQIVTAPVVNITPAVASPPAAPSKYILYKVKSGDSLSGIASQYHISFPVLAQLNNLSVPYDIYVGQSLKVPNPQILKAEVKAQSAQYGGEAMALHQQNALPVQNLTFTPVVVPANNPPASSPTMAASAPTPPAPAPAVVQVKAPAVVEVHSSAPVGLPYISPAASTTTDEVTWSWPVAGQVTGKFGQGVGLFSKGIEITTLANAKILAAAVGSVSFSGTGV